MPKANHETKDSRIANEILHGKYLLEHDPGSVWNWESPAGKERWKRRVAMLSSHLVPGTKVLEVGCGTGYFTRELVKTGADITAIDISPDLIEKARRENDATNVRFVVENAYAMSFPDGTFDTVIGSSVLHHLELDAALREFHRVLKPGGTVHFTEPNMLNPQIALQKNIPWLKRKMGDSPDETAFFRWQIVRALRRHGFDQVRAQPFDFLHPSVPSNLVSAVNRIGLLVEKIPLVSEIAGSLDISAVRAGANP
jgi:SAM-dependent methyltransferase